MKNSTDVYKTTTQVLFNIIIIPLLVMFGGFVTMFLWNGIMAPTFGITTLTFVQGIGVDCFVSYITYSSNGAEDNRGVIERVLGGLVVTLMFLLIGWVVMLCM